jgi:hypothetical protein
MYTSALTGFHFIVIVFWMVVQATFSSSLIQAGQQWMKECLLDVSHLHCLFVATYH